MAWRIDEQVIRGEIDNRIRGRVTGRIWFVGRDTPVEIDLAGNAWRDLAGRRLEFVNPDPQAGDLDRLAARQDGVIGDCTASRKVKVPDIPMSQIGEYYAARKKWTWHWGNSLYFEWFSNRNGRVVIESASYQLTIAPDIAWEMTPAEEEAQKRANAEATGAFMEQMGRAVAAQLEREGKKPAPDDVVEDEEWADENKPTTEAEAEKMDEESEQLTDRIMARMQREGPNADYEKILREELDRRSRERGGKPLTPEEEAQRAEWIDDVNRAAEEAANDPELRAEAEAEFNIRHPVAEQALQLSLRLMREPTERRWLPTDATEEHPLADLAGQTMKAGAKFAGALGGEWPPPRESCASRIVRLKRARGYLGDALLAAEYSEQENLADAAWLAGVIRELSSLAHECDRLTAELRARLEQGFE